MRRKLIGLLCLSAVFPVFEGCTEAELRRSAPGPVPGTESAVRITSSPALPGGAKYYFYSVQGGDPIVFDAAPDGNFDGKLPVGTYRVLAADTVIRGVEFRGMDGFGTASAYLKELPAVTPVSGRTLVSQPAGEVYALSIDGVVAEPGITAPYFATPGLLTRTYTLNLDVSRVPGEVIAVSGSLNGFYPGVNLSTREPLTENAGVTTVSFDAANGSNRAASLPATRAASFTAPVRCFGLSNPRPAGSDAPLYTSELLLTLTFARGDPVTLTRDLTGVIAKALSSGVLTINISIDPDNPDDPNNPDEPDDPDNPDNPNNPDNPGDPDLVPGAPAANVDGWAPGGDLNNN